ncbi:MAG: non-homologous end-joining DNA ligase [Verrucomicrobia bacterium]|nr:non-homologous end-joining DNA ligase [Verrucomicrobiota bacterium]
MSKRPFPEFVAPMMANTVKEPFDHPDWIFEPKLDGYRAIAVIDEAGQPHLWSRNGLTLEIKFPAVFKAVRKLKLRSTILDGEIVAIDDQGIPRFQLLQKWQKQPTAPIAYYLFDVLWARGADVTGEAVLERRRQFKKIISDVPGIQIGGYTEGVGKELFALAKGKGMEGIVAKRKDSIYQPGRRTSDWLKIKARLQQEFVVGGFTEGKGSRKNLGALLLGAYRNGKLHYFGHSGSGFTEKGIQDALKRMKPLSIEKSPFINPPRVSEKIQWLRPKLVCEVTFAEWTDDEQMRQTVFLGWREDKDSRDVVKEMPSPTARSS